LTRAHRRRKTLEEAWIGDAVLCLYARREILRAVGAVDGKRLQSVTSNRFLARFGEPSEVEAEIGRAFERDGLAAAFARIEQTMGAAFAKVLADDSARSRT
jgi:hypothetical protein